MRMNRLIPIIIILVTSVTGTGLGLCASCEDIKNASFSPDVTITSATIVAATATAPEHCDVRGKISPEIGFAVKLPIQWNGRFYMTGNHGYAGEIDHKAIDVGLRKGFATAGTDMGHDVKKEPGTTGFYHNRQKEIDFCYRATHETAITAKEVVKAYYGKAPAFSYFVGSSTGGRQGLMEAQRYPADFNGILSGMPVMEVCMFVQIAWYLTAILTPDSIGMGPVPVNNKIMTVEKLPLLEKTVYAKCDGIDGLVDGIIDDPRKCTFDPERDLPLCTGDIEFPECFTAKQVAALKKIYGGPISNGKSVCTKLCPGGEAMWANRFIGAGTNRPFEYSLNWDTFKYLFFKKDNPDYEFLRDFNFDTDFPKLDFMRRYFEVTDPELFPFMNNGGKIIITHAWADPSHPPLVTINYYEEVLDFMGSKAKDFSRLYMAPGVFRVPVEFEGPGGGGPGPDNFDLFGPLVDWVEKGIAPESIVASRIADGKVVRTRPLCPYPKLARYTGKGSIDEAVNFVCAEPMK
jgi:hypothetical protein